jgi:hypothetical protein
MMCVCRPYKIYYYGLCVRTCRFAIDFANSRGHDIILKLQPHGLKFIQLRLPRKENGNSMKSESCILNFINSSTMRNFEEINFCGSAN